MEPNPMTTREPLQPLTQRFDSISESLSLSWPLSLSLSRSLSLAVYFPTVSSSQTPTLLHSHHQSRQSEGAQRLRTEAAKLSECSSLHLQTRESHSAHSRERIREFACALTIVVRWATRMIDFALADRQETGVLECAGPRRCAAAQRIPERIFEIPNLKKNRLRENISKRDNARQSTITRERREGQEDKRGRMQSQERDERDRTRERENREKRKAQRERMQ